MPRQSQLGIDPAEKLLDVIRTEHLATQDPDDEDWYANLLVLDRRKCLLLTHAGTLFTIFEPDVRASDLKATKNLVVALIERELLAEGLPADVFGDLWADELLIAKTADRSVLGCMNDMGILCDVAVADARSLLLLDVASLNHRGCRGRPVHPISNTPIRIRVLRRVLELAAPRKSPEQLASPTSTKTRNRWSGACTPARGARLTSGRGSGGRI
ncbi:MAG: DUF6933 domain-containing protein [Acidimicrobiales bacterium]